jgi:hypothetical protein
MPKLLPNNLGDFTVSGNGLDILMKGTKERRSFFLDKVINSGTWKMFIDYFYFIYYF